MMVVVDPPCPVCPGRPRHRHELRARGLAPTSVWFDEAQVFDAAGIMAALPTAPIPGVDCPA